MNYRGGKFVKTYKPVYKVWANMKIRCNNPNCKDYKYYGARGITVCDQWVNSFENFYEDMGEPPKGLTIERINSNLGYSFENCRWDTRLQQSRNARTSKFWFIDGVRYESMRHAALVLGVGATTIRYWCNGKNEKTIHYPPKENCWSELKYEEGML